MTLWAITACMQCALLWLIWYGARKVIFAKKSPDAHLYREFSPKDLPMVGMIIPAKGSNPRMESALRSLLTQEYSNYIPIIVTASDHDPAHALAKELQKEFPLLECVVAGDTTQCGQKNHNTLKAIEHLGSRADIYVFCDSTHMAKADFLQELVAPIVRGEAGFTTGYHQVVAKDEGVVTIAYMASVLLMRVLQAVSVFTQPWGGAMAISRRVFMEHDIASFWQNNVVDDCSLAGMLMQKRLHVQLCPHALLTTEAEDHAFSTWQAWMQRQILFLKFCVMSQWYLLGAFACILTLPVIFSCCIILLGIFDAPIQPFYVLGAFVHLSLLIYIMLQWRKGLPCAINALSWIKGFTLGMGMLLKVYVYTMKVWYIDWHGIRYHVAKGGVVRHMQWNK